MDYNFSKDLKSIREILGVSQSELAEQIGVEQVTISRNELGKTEPSPKLLESIYSYAFLGKQYIFVSEKAASQVEIVERCYVSGNEREYYKNIRLEESKLGDDKVKLAKRQYRGQGRYIDEILE